MARVFNFNPGPAALPLPVLEKARDAVIDAYGWGMGVMEISHRSPQFAEILETLQERFRKLFSIPDNYKVLFCQGGARTQFGMIPMNFLREKAAYIDTGRWASKAAEEASIFGESKVIASSKETNYDRIPPYSPDLLTGREDYLHITTNNTIYGTQWHEFPDTKGVPLIADMSSDLASRPIDVSKFSLIYAGAQKNLGPAGVTVVIIDTEFAKRAKEDGLPTMLRYSTYIDHNSLFNTPPVWNIFVVGLVMEWIEENGGLEKIGQINREKAEIIYHLIDSKPEFFRGTAQKESRSLMNITFRLPTEELEKKLVAEAAEKGFVGIKGHRSVGGIRVSNYNAVPKEGIEKLAQFLEDFAKQNS